MDTSKLKVPVEVYSRVVGYFRPIQDWNVGKREEFKNRKTYNFPTRTSRKDINACYRETISS